MKESHLTQDLSFVHRAERSLKIFFQIPYFFWFCCPTFSTESTAEAMLLLLQWWCYPRTHVQLTTESITLHYFSGKVLLSSTQVISCWRFLGGGGGRTGCLPGVCFPCPCVSSAEVSSIVCLSNCYSPSSRRTLKTWSQL